MKLILFIIFLITSTFLQAQNKKDSIDSVTVKAYKSYIIQDASLINLIATPEKYHQKHIRVIGFLNIEFEGNAIYLHEEDYRRRISKNSIWINLNNKTSEKIYEDKLSKTYVILEGTFNMNNNGHMSLSSGSIEKITRVDSWKY